MKVISGLRVSDRVMARIPAVQKKLANDEKVTLLTNVTRSVAMRMSIFYGIKAMLVGHSVTKGLEPNSKHVSVSMPQWLLDRAQAIADKDPSGKTKRTHVLRSALEVGTGILQEEA